MWAGTTWFIRALFFTLLVFSFVEWFIKKNNLPRNIIQLVISVFLIILVWIFQDLRFDITYLNYCMGLVKQVFLAYACIFMGAMIKEYGIMGIHVFDKAVISFLILLICMN